MILRIISRNLIPYLSFLLFLIFLGITGILYCYWASLKLPNYVYKVEGPYWAKLEAGSPKRPDLDLSSYEVDLHQDVVLGEVTIQYKWQVAIFESPELGHLHDIPAGLLLSETRETETKPGNWKPFNYYTKTHSAEGRMLSKISLKVIAAFSCLLTTVAMIGFVPVIAICMRRKRKQCIGCGYSLKGLMAGHNGQSQCPECGFESN